MTSDERTNFERLLNVHGQAMMDAGETDADDPTWQRVKVRCEATRAALLAELDRLTSKAAARATDSREGT